MMEQIVGVELKNRGPTEIKSGQFVNVDRQKSSTKKEKKERAETLKPVLPKEVLIFKKHQ